MIDVLKSLWIFLLIPIAIFLNFWIYYLYVHMQEMPQQEYSVSLNAKDELSRLTGLLADLTNADIIGINIFHDEESDFLWPKSIKVPSNPKYYSAVYYWTREGIPSPIDAHRNRLVETASKVDKLLEGECSAWINTFMESIHPSLGKLLVVQCPIKVRGKVVGTLAISYTNYDENNMIVDVNRLLPIVLSYKPLYENALVGAPSGT